MASRNPNQKHSYPEVIASNGDAHSLPSNGNTSSNLYPTIDMHENLFPDGFGSFYQNSPRGAVHSDSSPSAPPLPAEEIIFEVPGAVLNLIDKQYSVQLASGDFTISRLCEGENTVTVLASVADEIQWPLTKDGAAVKLDDSHYFFTFRAMKENESDSSDEEDGKSGNDDGVLNYGLTIASKGKEGSLKELDEVLKSYTTFSVQKVSDSAKRECGALDESVADEISPADLNSERNKDLMERKCAAYWTTLAPNVEDYSGTAGKLIASGSGQLIKGILWCGDVTVDRLKRGNEVMKKRLSSGKVEIDPNTLKRIRRVKRVTKMSQRVASGVLSGVLKVSGFFTSSVANSKTGKKFFNSLPGEIVLASLDGFSKVCDAIEVAGRNVMVTSHTVTNELVTHRYGEAAAHAAGEGLEATGHALGTVWTAFKIRKGINPKNIISPSRLGEFAAKTATDMRAKKESK